MPRRRIEARRRLGSFTSDSRSPILVWGSCTWRREIAQALLARDFQAVFLEAALNPCPLTSLHGAIFHCTSYTTQQQKFGQYYAQLLLQKEVPLLLLDYARQPCPLFTALRLYEPQLVYHRSMSHPDQLCPFLMNFVFPLH